MTTSHAFRFANNEKEQDASEYVQRENDVMRAWRYINEF
jgi:hypothetical protein